MKSLAVVKKRRLNVTENGHVENLSFKKQHISLKATEPEPLFF